MTRRPLRFRPLVNLPGSRHGSARKRQPTRPRLLLERLEERTVLSGNTIFDAEFINLFPDIEVQVSEVIGFSEPDNDVDFFAVNLQAGDTLTLDIDALETGVSSLESVLQLFDDFGNVLASNSGAHDPDTNMFTFDAALVYPATFSGTFYVGVSGYSNFSYDPFAAYSGGTGLVGAYDFFLDLQRDETGGSGGTDVGDGRDTAQLVSYVPDQPVTLFERLGNNPFNPTGNEVDVYVLDLPANSLVSADIDSAELGFSLDSVLTVFDVQGHVLAVNDQSVDPNSGLSGNDSFVQFTTTTAGLYYVGVSSFANFSYDFLGGTGGVDGFTTGDYFLDLTVSPVGSSGDDVSDTIADAPTVFVTPNGDPTLVTEFLGNDDNGFGADEVDIFRLELQAGDLVTLDLDSDELNLGLDSILTVFDASGHVIAFNDQATDPETGIASNDSYLQFTAPSGGSFFVGVSSYANFYYDPDVAGSGSGSGFFTGEYRLFVGVARVGGGDDRDAGDTIGLAANVSPDLFLNRRENLLEVLGNGTRGNSEVDIYRLPSLAAGDIVRLDIDARELDPHNPLDSVLRLFRIDAFGTTLEVAVDDDSVDPDSGVSSYDSYIEYSVRPGEGGDYYVGVSSFANFGYDPNSTVGGSGGSGGDYVLGVRVDRQDGAEDDASDTSAGAGLVILPAGGTATATEAIGNNELLNHDVDQFRLDGLQAGDIVRVNLDARSIGLSNVDSILRAFDANGNQVAVNDDAVDPVSDQFSYDSYLEFTVQPGAGGTYFVGVSSFANFSYLPNVRGSGFGGSGGAYRLTFNLLRPEVDPDDAGNTLADAQEASLTEGQPSSILENLGNSGVADTSDVDIFRIELDAGDVVTVDIDAQEIGLSNVDTIVRVFFLTPGGVSQQIAINNDSVDPVSGAFSLDAALRFSVTQTGNYYVAVSSFANFSYNEVTGAGRVNGYSTGNYRLILTLSDPEVPQEAGDTISDARGVTLEPNQFGRVTEVSEEILGNNDVDLYRIQLDAGEVLTANVDARMIGLSNVDTILRVFDATGLQLAVNDDAFDPVTGTRSLDAAVVFAAPTTNTYYVGVSGFSNVTYNINFPNSGSGGSSQGMYRLFLTATSPPEMADPGHTLATATDDFLATNDRATEIAEEIDSVNDVDLYEIQLIPGQILTADIEARQIGLSNVDTILRIFDANGVPLAINDDAVDPDNGRRSRDAVLVFAAPLPPGGSLTTPGTYYVGVSAYSNTRYEVVGGTGRENGSSQGAYRLVLEVTSPPPPPVLPPIEPGEPQLGPPEQIVFLDFVGVDFEGGGSAATGWPLAQDVPAFSATDLGGSFTEADTQALIDRITELVRIDFTVGVIGNDTFRLDLPITITTDRPNGDRPFSTVFIGGSNSNNRLGAAEGSLATVNQVDIGNRFLNDNARVYSRNFRDLFTNPTMNQAAIALASTISHEIGHNLGLAHLNGEADGFLLQSGSEDDNQVEDERFGSTGVRLGSNLPQDDIAILQRNLRRLPPVVGLATTDDLADLLNTGVLNNTNLLPPLPPGVVQTVRGTLTTNIDQQFFTIPNGEPGDLLQIDLGGRELGFGIDTQYTLTLTGPNGAVVAASTYGDDPDSHYPNDPYIAYTVEQGEGGRYTIVVGATIRDDPGTEAGALAGRFVLDVRRLPQDIIPDDDPPDLDKVFVLNSATPEMSFVDANGDPILITLVGSARVVVSLEAGAMSNADIDSIVVQNPGPGALVEVRQASGDGGINLIRIEGLNGGRVLTSGLDIGSLIIDGRARQVRLFDGDVLDTLSIANGAGQVVLRGLSETAAVGPRAEVLIGGLPTASVAIDTVMAGGVVRMRGDLADLRIGQLNGAFETTQDVGTMRVTQPSTGSIRVVGDIANLNLDDFGPASQSLAEQGASTIIVNGRISGDFFVNGNLNAPVNVVGGITCLTVDGTVNATLTGGPIGCYVGPTDGGAGGSTLDVAGPGAGPSPAEGEDPQRAATVAAMIAETERRFSPLLAILDDGRAASVAQALLDEVFEVAAVLPVLYGQDVVVNQEAREALSQAAATIRTVAADERDEALIMSAFEALFRLDALEAEEDCGCGSR